MWSQLVILSKKEPKALDDSRSSKLFYYVRYAQISKLQNLLTTLSMPQLQRPL